MSKYKQFKKWVATTPVGQLRIPVLGWGCDTGMTLLQISWKMTDEFEPRAKQLIDSKTPVIYAIYHGRMAGLLHLPGRERTSILISNSRDGEMVARAMLSQGFLVSRGSPTHGALQAAKSMLKLLSTGKNVVVTVDGPRGPAMEMKPAVIRLAQKSGCPIIPVLMDAKHVKIMGSWDHFMFPHFFTHMRCFYGEPMTVPRSSSDEAIEQYRVELDLRMQEMTAKADAWAARAEKRGPIATT